MPEKLSKDGQLGGLTLLSYVSDLFTVTPREQFSRDEILVILSRIKGDTDLFEPRIAELFDRTGPMEEE